MKRRRILLALFASLTISAAPAMAQKKSLVVATSVQDINKLDPHQTASLDKGMVAWMFNGLVRIKPGQISPEFVEPDLAESWSSNQAGTEWTFKLRSGVKCHDGEEFTAEDAAYSLLRAANKETSAFSGDFAAIGEVEVIDPQMLKITLKNPIPSLLGLVSNYHGGMMVCKKAAEEGLDAFNKRPVGTGPFMFAEYQPQQYVRLTANKDYFRGAPQIEEITYRFIPSDATRDLAFQSGEVDMVFGRQTDAWVSRMREIPDARVAAIEPAELNTLHLNMGMKPLDDIRVRQAIAHALDRSKMVQLLGSDVSREAVSVVPNGSFGLDPKPGLLPYDVAKAKQLLAEAGYPDGITVKSVQSTLPSLLRLMEAVQAQLREAGIDLEIDAVDHPTYHANIRKDLSGVTLYQAARFPVADVYLTQFYYGPSAVGQPTAVTNFSHCNVADQEIEAARSEPDPGKQRELWSTAQKKIVADVCGIPFSESLNMWAWHSKLNLGYELNGSLNLAPPITEETRFEP